MSAPSPAQLRDRLPALMLRDEHRLRRRLEQGGADLVRLEQEVVRAEARVAQRRAAVPELRYPEQLPVSQRRDDLLAAVRDHQVVVVAGETGSGKTTQLPKICLELGRGVRGQIGHTQPRRLAARTVAERIAEETGTVLGSAVGYKVRFTDRSSDATLVKLMTDGVLLAEVQRDRLLRAYDTVIVDEAHERSLNIDFLLGYLRQLLPQRPDLKLVITSATIDPQRFAAHFGGAPVVEVSGRTYPVEVRYRPRTEEETADQVEAVARACDELAAEPPGDVLVFLSGEREIRDTAEALRKRFDDRTEVVPLYARLAAADQHKVFAPHTGRRIVLATNVAETSLTVPGIRYVVDPGTARISRYSLRTKVQRLPIEAVSQASADQRKGRCGRVAAGVCIRLYSEEDFESRPAFTDPEVLRTNLASVILQMTALGLGDVAAFPFLDPPDSRNVRDGLTLLHELGAIDPREPDPARRLTHVGRQLAQLPVDPRIGRMVLEADKNGCVHEVLVLAAGLSISDPRERPADDQAAADAAHARFRDPTSDFLSLLNLWRYLHEMQDELSGSAFRRMCKAEHLHYLRVREWQDLYGQLRSIAKGLGITTGEPREEVDGVRVHQSLLAGLLSQIGMQGEESRDYLGARGAKFVVWPGSALAKKPPKWVVAAELVETSRLFGRTVAKIAPEWVEPLAAHLVTRSYSEPHWSKKRAATVAFERVLLYGVPLVARRPVDYGRIDPEVSRETFLRHALVLGEWDTHHAVLAANRALIAEVAEVEHKARRRDLVIDDEALFALYDARVGPEVVSGRHFDQWWKQTRQRSPDLLTFTAEMLLSGAGDVSETAYPSSWTQDGVTLELTYTFEPGSPVDGVTAHVPVSVLNRVTEAGLSWQVPGLREELVAALLKSLPKPLRRLLVPAPDRARVVLAEVGPADGPLLPVLEHALRRQTGALVRPADWDLSRVPPHLRVTWSVEDEAGRVLATGKDLAALQESQRPKVRESLARVASSIERTGLTAWPGGEVPRSWSGGAVQGFPALVDEGDTVALRVLGSAAEQAASHALGTRRLLLLTCPSPLKALVGRMRNTTKLALAANPYGPVPVLLADCVAAAVDALVAEAGGVVWDEAGWELLHGAVRADLERRTAAVIDAAADVLGRAEALRRALEAPAPAALGPALDDLRAQLDRLVPPGFVSGTGAARLPDLLRYLRGMATRLDKLPRDPDRDRLRMREVQELQAEVGAALAALPPGRAQAADARALPWMVEELRLGLFAQDVRTAYPVSEKRVLRALDAVTG